MDTDSMRTCLSNGGEESLSVPPGFVSRKSFLLKRVGKVDETDISKTSVLITEQEQIQMKNMSGTTETEMMEESLKHRPWILFDQSNDNCDESNSAELESDLPPHLPKGVIRGCPDCSNCLKVTARWRPEDARKDVLEEVPVLYPTEEEFEDTLKYIENISTEAEPYGICRIVPPPSWVPPCRFKQKEVQQSFNFVTRIQQIDGLQKQYSQGTLTKFSEIVKGKRRRFSAGHNYEHCNRSIMDAAGSDDLDKNGIQSELGPEFTLEAFKKYADDFKVQYFYRRDKVVSEANPSVLRDMWVPTVENIEAEYRRIVENPTEEIEVLSGVNLDRGVFGSGFPTVSSLSEKSDKHNYLNSGWNLNNLPRLPGSLLSFESCNTCPILVPRVHVGMCFSMRFWQVQEHHLPMLCYMHLGSPKIWYSIPGSCIHKFEAAVKKYFPDMMGERHGLRVKQLSPSALKSEAIPVYRCIQYPGEFILVQPGAYISGFDCGFNCAEEANFAPLGWLPYGQNAVDLYCAEGRKTSISYDKLLLEAATEAVKAQWEFKCGKNTADNLRWRHVCGKDGVLAKALKSRIKNEGIAREYLCATSKVHKMSNDFDSNRKRECSICLYDLHLSAVSCLCSADRHSCLIHARQLCSCAWGKKNFLVRYEMSELYLLLEALEGDIRVVYRWAKENLGLNLGDASRNSLQQSQQLDRVSSQKEHRFKDTESPSRMSSSAASIKEEIKARVRSKALDKAKVKEKAIGSEAATSSRSCIKAEMKARLLKYRSLSELNQRDNSETLRVFSGATTNNRSTTSFLHVEMPSDVSSESTTISSSSDSVEDVSDARIRLFSKLSKDFSS